MKDTFFKYKNIIKAFGGYALYIDKDMAEALNVKNGDEVTIEIRKGCVIVKKSVLSSKQLKEITEKITKPLK